MLKFIKMSKRWWATSDAVEEKQKPQNGDKLKEAERGPYQIKLNKDNGRPLELLYNYIHNMLIIQDNALLTQKCYKSFIKAVT